MSIFVCRIDQRHEMSISAACIACGAYALHRIIQYINSVGLIAKQFNKFMQPLGNLLYYGTAKPPSES